MKKIHHMTAKKRIGELQEAMRDLGLSDNYLFSNLNGNLHQYNAWQDEERELQRGLDKNKPYVDPHPELRTKWAEDEPEDFPEEEHIKVIDDALREDLKQASKQLERSVETLEQFVEEGAP